MATDVDGVYNALHPENHKTFTTRAKLSRISTPSWATLGC